MEALIASSAVLSLGLLFWILMIIWLIFGFWSYYRPAGNNYFPFGSHLLFWVLLFLIGWEVFGFPIAGR